MPHSSDFRHVNDLWDDAAANALDPVGRLIYRSNLLGSDGRITNTGGGNTSSKIEEKDPFTGQSVEVLWVKGSGGDLRTSKKENFASLYLDSVLSLEALYLETPRGRARPENRRRGPHGGDVPALHVQSEPARQQHRHAAARVRAREARGPHASERRHRHRRVGERRKTDAGNLRRRGGLHALAAAGLRPRAEAARRVPPASAGEGRHPRAARPHQLGRRRQGMLRTEPAPDRARGGVHREARQGQGDVRRREPPTI